MLADKGNRSVNCERCVADQDYRRRNQEEVDKHFLPVSQPEVQPCVRQMAQAVEHLQTHQGLRSVLLVYHFGDDGETYRKHPLNPQQAQHDPHCAHVDVAHQQRHQHSSATYGQPQNHKHLSTTKPCKQRQNQVAQHHANVDNQYGKGFGGLLASVVPEFASKSLHGYGRKVCDSLIRR